MDKIIPKVPSRLFLYHQWSLPIYIICICNAARLRPCQRLYPPSAGFLLDHNKLWVINVSQVTGTDGKMLEYHGSKLSRREYHSKGNVSCKEHGELPTGQIWVSALPCGACSTLGALTANPGASFMATSSYSGTFIVLLYPLTLQERNTFGTKYLKCPPPPFVKFFVCIGICKALLHHLTNFVLILGA